MEIVPNGQRVDFTFEDEEPGLIAATLIAVCAYPEMRELEVGGQADLLRRAIMARHLRIARACGRIERLPPWILPRREMDARIRRGWRRIDQMNACQMIFFDLSYSQQSDRQLFQMDWSRDFSRLRLGLHFNEQGRLVPLKASEPKSLTSALKEHQPAFGLGADELGSTCNDGAKTLRRRYFSRFLRVLHLFGPLKSQMLSCADEAERRGLCLMDFLILQPDWVLEAVRASGTMAPYLVRLAQNIGIKTASMERMVHLHLPPETEVLGSRAA